MTCSNKKICVSITLLLLSIAITAILSILLSRPKVDVLIATYGDSITDSGKYGRVMQYGSDIKSWYQYYMYNYFVQLGIRSAIYDLGIGGQIIEEICARVRSMSLTFNYITIMAGTNNVFIQDNATYISNVMITEYNYTINDVRHNYNIYGVKSPIFILCTIPPVAQNISINGLDGEKGSLIIQYVNKQLADFVTNLNDPTVILSDVHYALSGPNDRYFAYPDYTIDGIHFTDIANLIAGQTISQTIYEYMLHSAASMGLLHM